MSSTTISTQSVGALDLTEKVERSKAPALRLGAMLAVLISGQFMSNFDASIVNVAGPTMQTHLHTSGAGLQLIISGYTLALAMMLVTGARLGDEHGHRRIFIMGVVGFTVMSLLCGLAPNEQILIVARFLQGTAAGLMAPQSMSIIQKYFTGASRQRGMSFYFLAVTVGVLCGQIIGGLLVQNDILGLSWRIIFFVNVPVGIALVLSALRFLPEHDAHERRNIDIPGMVLLTIATAALVLPLIIGREERWPLWAFISMALSVVVFAVFMKIERRVVASGRQPLLDIELFANKQFSLAVGALFAAVMSYGTFMLANAVFLQSGLHLQPAKAGLVFIPLGLTFGAGSILFPKFRPSVQKVLFRSGLLIAAVSYVGIGLVAMHAHHVNIAMLVLFATVGFGLSVTNAPLAGKITQLVTPDKAPSASGIITTTAQLSQVIGVATFGSLFFSAAGHGGFGHGLGMTSLALAAAVLLAGLGANLLKS